MSYFAWQTIACSFIVIVGLVAIYVLASISVWRRVDMPFSILLLAILSFLTTGVWMLGALFVGFVFVGTPVMREANLVRDIFFSTIGIPLDKGGFLLVASGLFVLGLFLGVSVGKAKSRTKI